jgi:hypothetical protein
MKKTQILGSALLLVAIANSCKQASKTEESASEAISTMKVVTSKSEEANETVSSPDAVEPKNPSKKFLRTADVKYKVKNVPKSTYVIEEATTKFGGYVTYTNLQSNVSEKKETKVSPDSSLVTTKYTVQNDITIRVPNKQMDTIIKCITNKVDFFDYRVIKQDDVSLQLLSNEMAQNRSNSAENRLANAIDNKGKKLNDVIEAEDLLNNKKEQNDGKKLENLALNDKISFSTITLQIYQPETIKQEMIPNEKSINAYRPNIGLQIWDSLKTGWFMLEGIIAFVVQLWGLALLGVIGYFATKKILKSTAKSI